MPAAIAIPAIMSAVGTGASVATSVYGAKKQGKANDTAIQFGREQAENAYQNSEVTRHANYDQWAADQRQKNALRSAMGWGVREIPGYAPGVDPRFGPGAVGDYLTPRQPAMANPLPGSVGSYLRG